MKRTVRFIPLSLLALIAGSYANATELPNIDAYLDAAPLAPAASTARSSKAPLGHVASTDPQRGVPTFFWAAPQKKSLPAAHLMSAGPEQLARAYVEQNAETYGLPRASLATVYVKHVHDTGRGGIIVILGQRLDGAEVFETEMKVLMNRQGELVAIGGNLHADATPRRNAPERAFVVPDTEAIANAFGDLYEVPLSPSDLIDLQKEKLGYRYYDLDETASARAQDLAFNNAARAKKVFYPLPDRVVPAYYLELDVHHEDTSTSDLFGYVIAADTGEVLMRRNLSQDVAFNYRVWAETTAPYAPLDGPHAEFAPHPTGMPDGSSPAFIAPSMISIEGFNTNPSGMADPWLHDTATQTNGNNCDAYADLGGGDGYNAGTDLRATTTSANTFDRVYDTAQAPQVSNDQIMASVAQLFYDVNWLHDYYYDSGFDEAAGNAQLSNFGRGGLEGDPLRAEAQDSSGTNNANMYTPADGASPRMQMYIWSGAPVTTLNVMPINLSPPRQAAGFGPTSFNITAPLVLGEDGAGLDVNDGCEALTNTVTGSIVLVNRGNCTFELKVQNAQTAGAVGVLITNNVAAGLPGMADDTAIPPNVVTIGSFGISQEDGNTLKTELMNGPLTVTMTRVPTPNRDGTIDNGIVAHEWGHYIHHRLVACGATQCGGESEGWGDFMALMLAIDEGDNIASGTYAAAIYSTAILGDSGYFGIRRFPYSRDMAKNGLTFRHVTNGQALPAGPTQPAAPDNWEVHNSGEVWAQMLFQAYTGLLMNGGHTFTEAKRRMADYIVAGMKMAPPNPTFTEQRDGILAAAAAADPNDFILLAQGFADRGAGTCAVSPTASSTDGVGVVEDFTLSGQPAVGAIYADDSIVTCDGDGVLDAEETGRLMVEVFNAGAGALTNAMVTVSTSAAGVTFPNGSTATVASISPFGTGTAMVDVALNNSFMNIADIDFTVSVASSGACTPNVQGTATLQVNYDETPQSSATDTVESPTTPWTMWSAPGYAGLAGAVWSRDSEASGNHRWYGQNFAALSDTAIESPDLMVSANQNFVITFDHAHDFEASVYLGSLTYWDGGLIEISTNGGQTWQDISTYVSPGYNGTIAAIVGADNPLGNRPGFVDQNAAWPNTNTVMLDLGNALAGQTVRVRFRIGTDAAEGVPNFQGWFIDNIGFQGITNTPFSTVAVDPPGCNTAPLASAGPDQTVYEGDLVTLDATMSSDADLDPLMYAWSQTAGPNVMLSDPAIAMPTFTAPQVAADTMLTFEVAVDDGIASDTDTVNVLVLDMPVGTGGAGGMGQGGMGGMGQGGMGGMGTGGMGGMGTGGSGTGGSGTGGSGTGGSGTGGSGTGGAGGNGTGGSGTGGAGGVAAGGMGGMGQGGMGTGGMGTGGTPTTTTGGDGGSGGDDPTEDDGGCGCRTAGSSSTPQGSALASLLAAAAFLVRRRRGGSRS